MDAHTGARWGELAGQQPHEYDRERRAVTIQQPLKEINGKLFKAGRPVDASATGRDRFYGDRRPKAKNGRTKTPAGTRMVELPPSIARFYELLLDSEPDRS
jgi:hypothetical protein